MASAAAHVCEVAGTAGPALEPRRLAAGPPVRRPSVKPGRGAHDALLESAIELFAHHGPASVSIRDVARHAGVNHGLVHRHFGSKDDLLAAAIETGTSSLLPGALAAGGFDIDDVVDAMHHESAAPKLIARTLVDDIAIGSVRRRFPVMRGLLAVVEQVPHESRPPGLADPRLAAAAVGALVAGSVIWGPSLRDVLGLGGDDGVESAVADLSRHLLGLR
jgi:TetR/AcrR family transcriptional regulator, repressor for neighboring sulfatase